LSMLAGANSLRKTSAFMDERLGQLNSLLGTNWRKAPSWVALALIGIDPLLLTETDPRGLISGDRSRDA
jgi:hypothetical protein